MEGDAEVADDPVQHEVDVFLTRALAGKLFLLQYPLRPAHMPYSPSLMKEVKVKPGLQQVSMEVSVQPSGDNYSDSRGENIAEMVELGRPGGGGAVGPYYPSGYMDRMTLCGRTAVPPEGVGRYAVGVLRAGELHLTPLQGAVQVRPSCEYLVHKATGERRTRQAAARSDTESSEEEEEEARPMTVRFARHGNKPQTDPAPSQCDEEWVHLQPVAFEDSKADAARQLLFCQEDVELSSFTASSSAYLNAVLPVERGEGVELPSSRHSTSGLRDLPLSEAVRTLMLNVGVLPFAHICTLLGAHSPLAEGEVLEELQRVCVLVQGCWVVHSSVLYPKDYTSPHNSVCSDVLCRARDNALHKFTLSEVVTRQELVGGVRVPPEELLDILRGLARQRPGVGWEFKYKRDEEFLLHHLEVVAKQREWWRNQESLSASLMVGSRPGEGDPVRSKPRGAQRKSKAPVVVGRQVCVEEAGDHHGPVKVEPIADVLPGDGGGATLPMDVLKEWLQEAVGRGVASLSQLCQKLQQDQATCPSGHPLRQVTVSDEVLLKGLTAAGATEVDGKWMSLDGTRPRFFVMPQVGDETDKHRPHLLELLKQSKGVRKKQLSEEIEKATGTPPNAKLLTVLLRDLCYSRGAYWYMNGT